MDSQGTDRIEDLEVAETPEDVAVLYSWANLHGAKYRDFSASRREYRAQLRHRAAEQVRDQALLAKAEADAAAAAADSTARRAARVSQTISADGSDSSRQSLREAEEAAHNAAAERVEAARRAEAAALAEAAARREEREIAEAHASAQRQAARYADSEIRRKAAATGQPQPPPLPGRIISDAGITQPQAEHSSHQPVPSLEEVRPSRFRRVDDYVSAPVQPEQRTVVAPASGRRPQGYHPDDASGVREIYRGPDLNAPQNESRPPLLASIPQQEQRSAPEQYMYSQRPSSVSYKAQPPNMGQRRTDQQFQPERRASRQDAGASSRPEPWPASSENHIEPSFDPGLAARRDSLAHQTSGDSPSERPADTGRAGLQAASPAPPVSPFSQSLIPTESTRGRRAQDDFDYKQFPAVTEPPRRIVSSPPPEATHVPSQRPPYAADPAGPAWLYAPPTPPPAPKPATPAPPVPQSSVADTLQHSRERVASRWFALKGVFEQPGQEQPEATPVRQKETRTPVLAVFSLAGGVGKTSLVATVGRSLSSLGEKVLLTDTTSHGLLPFYFGASELRPGTVRTFSPPSGSTDAPIYLVSYDVEQKGSDEAAQELLVEEVINNSRGTHRILLDLNTTSSWIVRRMARMSPTILVPVAPDMNSVISLQSVERYFHGVTDGDGRPLQPFYVLNQFDTSLPLHLDVREVLRRQLGDRLLPFVIRRAPSVSEALAEGMTVVDYVPDAPVAEDYLNLATWLRTIAAPATAGFRNVRWSER